MKTRMLKVITVVFLGISVASFTTNSSASKKKETNH